ncbi:group I intron-associated PD-(D/E)XK endonuclease [Salinirubellus salinus]|uniref:Group I intron-associated PD-(D/E)XK endonuclease n=1 Tax=Salinirubellus salinus TaxID=1364945 RepID=A0A9E7R396_9EURY|nr:group I intron-associated PD-(D/E)XK endonuclease [Salinirubellus salinus]UWM53993.1 group I intron-associated PD-(D/E)XK endonuclease [Salinirubellus salinus]
MESHRKGELTEAVVVAELKRRGIPVSRPFGDNERYDVVAETPGGALLKLQVKTGRFERGTVVFDGVSTHTNSQGNVYKPYEDDVDYFLVYSDDLETLYIVPESRVGSSMALRVEAPKQTDPKINDASAYLFDENWPPDTDERVQPVPGNGAVQAVTEAFDALGASVYRTESDDVYIVETGEGRLIRVRLGRVSEQGGRLRAGDLQSGLRTTDYYALYDPSREQTYLVAADEFGASLSLRTDEPEQIQHDTRFAEDYRLEAVWPPDGVPNASPRPAVGAAVARFESLGVPVGVVHDGSVPYDLLAAAEDGFRRVAVVPGWCSRGCLRLKPESKAGVDAYVVYHRDSDTCYAVDADRFARSISLRVEPPAKPDPRINEASEFELERNWPV